MVIGHEMTHGFDDQGRQYDAQGNMKDWWTKPTGRSSPLRGDRPVQRICCARQPPCVNGALTLGENLADIGGLAIAWDAFKLTKQGQGKENRRIYP